MRWMVCTACLGWLCVAGSTAVAVPPPREPAAAPVVQPEPPAKPAPTAKPAPAFEAAPAKPDPAPAKPSPFPADKAGAAASPFAKDDKPEQEAKSIATLTRELQSDDGPTRTKAVEALTVLEVRAVPAMLKLQQSTDANDRAQAGEVLRRINVAMNDRWRNTILIEAELEAVRSRGVLLDPGFRPALDRLRAAVGDDPAVNKLFASMMTGEPGLLLALSRGLEARSQLGGADKPGQGNVDKPGQDAAAEAINRYFGSAIYSLHYERARAFSTDVRKTFKGSRVSGKPYPASISDEHVGRLAAMLFVISEFGPGMTRQGLSYLRYGLVSYMQSYGSAYPAPFYLLIKDPKTPRAKALRTLTERALLASTRGSESQYAFQYAMTFKFPGLCLEMAHRTLAAAKGDKPLPSGSMFMAAHALRLHGSNERDLKAAVALLANVEQQRISARKANQPRRYIEVREMALAAVVKMMKVKPQDVSKLGTKQSDGYCPVKKWIKFDFIQDADGWKAVDKQLRSWSDGKVNVPGLKEEDEKAQEEKKDR